MGDNQRGMRSVDGEESYGTFKVWCVKSYQIAAGINIFVQKDIVICCSMLGQFFNVHRINIIVLQHKRYKFTFWIFFLSKENEHFLPTLSPIVRNVTINKPTPSFFNSSHTTYGNKDEAKGGKTKWCAHVVFTSWNYISSGMGEVVCKKTGCVILIITPHFVFLIYICHVHFPGCPPLMSLEPPKT